MQQHGFLQVLHRGRLVRPRVDGDRRSIAKIAKAKATARRQRLATRRRPRTRRAALERRGGRARRRSSPGASRSSPGSTSRTSGWKTAWTKLANQTHVRDFFRVLAVCHTVIPEGEPTPESIWYQAESPDESAFVVAAIRFGFFFKARHTNGVDVDALFDGRGGDARTETFQILNILEFNSTRKRMSVIAKTPEGDIVLYCKGADSIIYERLRHGAQKYAVETQTHADEYAAAAAHALPGDENAEREGVRAVERNLRRESVARSARGEDRRARRRSSGSCSCWARPRSRISPGRRPRRFQMMRVGSPCGC